MNCSEANSIPIDTFLSTLGIEPVKIRALVKWYLSPLRTEKTASFVVDTRINKWYDFGIGEGGNLVNLGIRLWKCSVSAFLVQLSQNNFNAIVVQSQTAPPLVVESRVLQVKHISHPVLIGYLRSRAIPLHVANSFCVEVHYSNNDRNYFAIGMKNDADGFEVRNSAFKGCIGKKDITTLHHNASRVALFEGFFDFLSAHQLFKNVPNSTVIILNSITQLSKAMQRLEFLKPDHIESYFNNDVGGKQTTVALLQRFPNAINYSKLFEPHNDINDFLKLKKGLNISI